MTDITQIKSIGRNLGQMTSQLIQSYRMSPDLFEKLAPEIHEWADEINSLGARDNDTRAHAVAIAMSVVRVTEPVTLLGNVARSAFAKQFTLYAEQAPEEALSFLREESKKRQKPKHKIEETLALVSVPLLRQSLDTEDAQKIRRCMAISRSLIEHAQQEPTKLSLLVVWDQAARRMLGFEGTRDLPVLMDQAKKVVERIAPSEKVYECAAKHYGNAITAVSDRAGKEQARHFLASAISLCKGKEPDDALVIAVDEVKRKIGSGDMLHNGHLAGNLSF